MDKTTTSTKTTKASSLDPTDTFVHRHIGPNDSEIAEMCEAIGVGSLDELVDQTVPKTIRLARSLNIGPERGEFELINELRTIALKNKVYRSCIGMGYSDCITPPVILRNILENPGWYTQYTPYQAEISQGRLEALLNFQTMVADLTALPLAGASLLDEATAAAEAMAMCHALAQPTKDGHTRNVFFIAEDCHPQTVAVCRTRAKSMGLRIVIGRFYEVDLTREAYCGVLIQYPSTDGRVELYKDFFTQAHEQGILCVAAADLLMLTLVTAPGEFGADIAIGSTQRFGVPMGFGGPHAAYIATKNEYARKMPGRIIGVSRDVQGRTAYRMAIQTREQHIRREKATSNICTAQALLAIMAGMYAVYHGPEGLTAIAQRIHSATAMLRLSILKLGHEISDNLNFDSLRVEVRGGKGQEVISEARKRKINLRDFGDGTVGVSLDETVDRKLLHELMACFGETRSEDQIDWYDLEQAAYRGIPDAFRRRTPFLTHPVFNTYHSETELLRYIFKLQSRDLSLAQAMIPLGSCTMKLNGTSEMLPVTWPEFGRMHPFAPADQTEGYRILFRQLEAWLEDITGFAAISLQPNAGSQGEYAGLLVIRAYHESRGQGHRDVCLIPTSAHGTNPASAVIAGMRVVPVECDRHGNVDLNDLAERAKEHADNLAALMITYPSTHGVFEPDIKAICKCIHDNGGQVYMDGANMNAQVGLCSPGDIGADVCHLNLHKTFCIPHGGGGPGMGPIGVAKHLAEFLPTHPIVKPDSITGDKGISPVAAAPYGSPSILTISWVYIALMGSAGLKRATEVAILNANYMASRLSEHYDILYKGVGGRVAHEFILDCRPFEKSAGIKVEDVAKRLMDYSFHAPTMSFPVPGTLMIEPTESESKAELDRLCNALIQIRQEIRDIEEGKADREDNVLKNAPHPVQVIAANEWTHPYGREQAAFPVHGLHDDKFWPCVSRIDNPYGDRNLICSCPPMTEN